MDEAEKQQAESATFKEASALEGSSSFVVRAAKADSVNDVRALYKAIMYNPQNMKAHHNSLAYRLYDPNGAKTTDGYCDDGEYGIGRHLRHTLHERNARNVAVFVTRRYGGTHLGPQRFMIVKELTKSVIEQLKATE